MSKGIEEVKDIEQKVITQKPLSHQKIRKKRKMLQKQIKKVEDIRNLMSEEKIQMIVRSHRISMLKMIKSYRLGTNSTSESIQHWWYKNNSIYIEEFYLLFAIIICKTFHYKIFRSNSLLGAIRGVFNKLYKKTFEKQVKGWHQKTYLKSTRECLYIYIYIFFFFFFLWCPILGHQLIQ